MDSNEVKGTTELKYLQFLKEIALKFLAVLANIYDFAKEKAGVLETKVAPVEKAIVSALKPMYQKLKDMTQQILVMVDDKLDKYASALSKILLSKLHSLYQKSIPLLEKFDKVAPPLSKTLLAKFESLVDKATPLVKKLIPIVTPLITTAISYLEKLVEKIKSIPVAEKAHALLEKALSVAMSLIKSLPLVGTIQSLLQKRIDAIKSLLNGLPLVGTLKSILQKSPADLANQAMDTTKAVLGGIPIVGETAQSLITNPTDVANQLLDTTNNLVNETPVLGAVNSAAQNIVKDAQAAGTKAALQTAYLTFQLAAIPVIAQFWYNADKYPLFHSLAGVLLPWIEYLAEEYNKVVKYMVGEGYGLFGYLPELKIEEMKAGYKVVKTAGDLVPGMKNGGN